jgi:hypothetical protein
MVLKIFRVGWFFSLLSLLGIFMYVYAALPDPVIVFDDGGEMTLRKEAVFYIFLFLMAIFNMLVYVFRRMFPTDEEQPFVSWFVGLVICLNIFFVVSLAFLSLYNSNEKFDYPRIGPIIYGSIGLLIVWTLSWPLWTIVRRFVPRSPAPAE